MANVEDILISNSWYETFWREIANQILTECLPRCTILLDVLLEHTKLHGGMEKGTWIDDAKVASDTGEQLGNWSNGVS